MLRVDTADRALLASQILAATAATPPSPLIRNMDEVRAILEAERAPSRIVDGAAGIGTPHDPRPAHCRVRIVTGYAFLAKRASEFSQEGFYLGDDYDPFADEREAA